MTNQIINNYSSLTTWFLPLFNPNVYAMLIIDQKKMKLEAMEKEDDLDTAMAKLIDQAEKCNIQRFNCAMELKVKLFLGSALKLGIIYIFLNDKCHDYFV